jgi:hypothetical protein
MTTSAVTTFSDREKKMLGWLPQVGEWYKVSAFSALWAFESLEELKAHYMTTVSRKGREEPSTMFRLSHTNIFITRITLPLEGSNDPVIFDFMSRGENEGLKKVMFFAFYPPSSATGARIWQMLLECLYV